MPNAVLSFQKFVQSNTAKWSAIGVVTLAAAIGCARAPTQQADNSNAQTNTAAATGDIKLLNVSYDVARDFYKDYNPKFVQEYAQTHNGAKIDIQQSHGGSSKQALAVVNGLQADVVSMNQGSDIELLVKKVPGCR